MKKLSRLSMCMCLACVGTAGLLSSCNDSNLTKIGILEYITQDALEEARTGFISKLAERGYEDGKNISIDYENPEADSSTQATMASKLARQSDMVFGIATPSAVALKTAVDDNESEIPVIYTACTDPVGAGLITSVTDHKNVVGTSDAGPTAKNIDLFPLFKDGNGKTISKIGILYSTAESNSIVQREEAKAECKTLGIELVDGGVADKTLIASTLKSMITQGIQGLFVPTDNAVASAMESMKDTLIDSKILTVCADAAETKNGGSLGFSVSYTTLGETTGAMAADLLDGKDIADITCSLSASFPLEMNNDFFTSTGIAIPENLPTTATL